MLEEEVHVFSKVLYKSHHKTLSNMLYLLAQLLLCGSATYRGIDGTDLNSKEAIHM
jgi:hypothetical protein